MTARRRRLGRAGVALVAIWPAVHWAPLHGWWSTAAVSAWSFAVGWWLGGVVRHLRAGAQARRRALLEAVVPGEAELHETCRRLRLMTGAPAPWDPRWSIRTPPGEQAFLDAQGRVLADRRRNR